LPEPVPYFILNPKGLPLPVISEIAGGVNVIITANRDTLKDTLINGEKETIIMQKIREKPTVTADELSKILNINLRNTKKYLTQLKEQGKIMRMGSRKTGYWQVI
jgi:predicted HTH transcriptional regulator